MCVPRNQLPLFPALKSCIQQLNSISLRLNLKVKNQAPFHGITSRARIKIWQHRQRNEAKTTSIFFGKVQLYAGIRHRCTHGTKSTNYVKWTTEKEYQKVSHRSSNSVDLHPGKAFCPAPSVWMPVFWWRGRRWAALCAVAGHPGPSPTQAEWEWALATAGGNPGGPPWLSAPQFGWLSVVKQRQETKNDPGRNITRQQVAPLEESVISGKNKS